MVKYLLLAVLLIWLLYSPALRRKSQPNKPAKRSGSSPEPTSAEANTMLRCAHCGLHLPSDEAVLDAKGRTYCGDTHRQAGPQAS